MAQFDRLRAQGPRLAALALAVLHLKRIRQQTSPGPLFDADRSPVEEVWGRVPLKDLTFADQAVTGQLAHRRGPLAFTLAHPLMRPELHVLVPLFAKAIGAKDIRVRLRVEFGPGGPAVLAAASEDLAKLTAEVLEELTWTAVRTAFRRRAGPEAVLFTGEEYQDDAAGPHVRLGTPEVLARLLAANPGAHEAELRYLAAGHAQGVFPMRFVVRPYVAFLFLLEGAHGYWFAFETYKARLATCLWPCPKDPAAAQLLFADELVPAVATICRQQRLDYVRQSAAGLVRLDHEYRAPDTFARWRQHLDAVLAR